MRRTPSRGDPAGLFSARAVKMAGMDIQPNQFSIKRMLLAILWIGLGLAIWQAGSPFDSKHFLDDDPDNIRPRMFAAFFMVPIAGAAGSLRGRPIAFAVSAFSLAAGVHIDFRTRHCAVVLALHCAEISFFPHTRLPVPARVARTWPPCAGRAAARSIGTGPLPTYC